MVSTDLKHISQITPSRYEHKIYLKPPPRYLPHITSFFHNLWLTRWYLSRRKLGQPFNRLLGVFPRKKKKKTNPTMPHCTCRVKPWQRMKLHRLVQKPAFHTRFSILMGRLSSKHQPFKGSQNKNIKNQVAYLAAHGTDRN